MDRFFVTALIGAIAICGFGIEAETAWLKDKADTGCTTLWDKDRPYTFCESHTVGENRPPPRDDAPFGFPSVPVPKGKVPPPAGSPAPPKAAAPSPPQVPIATNVPQTLSPVRALIEPAEIPPREVAGYGLIAFSSMPLPQHIDRYKFVCEAFKATLIPQDQLPRNVPLSQQMITFWPIRNKNTAEALRFDCHHLVSNYDLKTALDAINDADKQKERLAERRGPFLIAWSPSESRYKKDSLVLVMDLSSLESQQSFLEVLKDWRQKIIDNPEMWKRGFDLEAIRRTIRDTLDRYGDDLLNLIKSKS
jgi:hypothetical protein